MQSKLADLYKGHEILIISENGKTSFFSDIADEKAEEIDLNILLKRIDLFEDKGFQEYDIILYRRDTSGSSLTLFTVKHEREDGKLILANKDTNKYIIDPRTNIFELADEENLKLYEDFKNLEAEKLQAISIYNEGEGKEDGLNDISKKIFPDIDIRLQNIQKIKKTI